MVWIERRQGAVWAVGRAVNPQHRSRTSPGTTTTSSRGYELEDALEQANAVLEDDLRVSEDDGRAAARPPVHAQGAARAARAVVLRAQLGDRLASLRRVLIRLGHSPDPDDAFMFWALAEDRVDTRGFEFEHVLKDIQTLNEWALEGKLEVTAISLHSYPHVQDRYVLLPHGASMGSGYGPIVVAPKALRRSSCVDVEIAVPGKMTTAFLVLRLFLGDFRYREVPFDEILDEVQSRAAPRRASSSTRAS